MRQHVFWIGLSLPLSTTLPAQEPVSLIDGSKPGGGWKYDNGPEFPGARGHLELAAEP